METLIKPFCFTVALSSNCNVRVAFTRKRCHYLPRHATETVQSNCVKVVPVQKTGPPVLRNEKTRKSTASDKKKRLRHHRPRNVRALIRRARDRKYFWSYHFTRWTWRIPFLRTTFVTTTKAEYLISTGRIFWRGADRIPAFSRFAIRSTRRINDSACNYSFLA